MCWSGPRCASLSPTRSACWWSQHNMRSRSEQACREWNDWEAAAGLVGSRKNIPVGFWSGLCCSFQAGTEGSTGSPSLCENQPGRQNELVSGPTTQACLRRREEKHSPPRRGGRREYAEKTRMYSHAPKRSRPTTFSHSLSHGWSRRVREEFYFRWFEFL